MAFTQHEEEVKNENDNFKVQIQDPNTPSNIAAVVGDALKVTGGGGGQEFLDDALVNAGADLGSVSMGKDTANGRYQMISVNANGELQVDVLSVTNVSQLPSTLVGGRLDVNIGADLPIVHSIDNIRLGDGTLLVDAITSGGGNRLLVETYPSNATGSEQNVIITDPNTPSQQAEVDAAGRLQVSTPTPVAPPSATAVVQSVDGNLGGNAVRNIYYTITNAKTLTLQRFESAGEGAANNGWFFELHEDPLGTGGATTDPVPASWNLISLMVIQENGDSKFLDISGDYVGDGTRRIVLRAVRLGGGGGKRGYMKFTGFEI